MLGDFEPETLRSITRPNGVFEIYIVQPLEIHKRDADIESLQNLHIRFTFRNRWTDSTSSEWSGSDLWTSPYCWHYIVSIHWAFWVPEKMVIMGKDLLQENQRWKMRITCELWTNLTYTFHFLRKMILGLTYLIVCTPAPTPGPWYKMKNWYHPTKILRNHKIIQIRNNMHTNSKWLFCLCKKKIPII